MKMFMLKSFCIAALMFISVLTGIQMANGGIHKMIGDDQPQFQSPAFLENQNQNPALEDQSSSHDLLTKKQKLEERNKYNFFSSMGKKISDGISKTSGELLNSIAK